MKQYINKAAVVAELDRPYKKWEMGNYIYEKLISFLNTLEVKEIQKKNLYVVTRCEEHSDYVEKAFFSKEKAENYCKQFEGNEDAYGRDITEIEVDYPLEAKEVDFGTEVYKYIDEHFNVYDDGNQTLQTKDKKSLIGSVDLEKIAKHFFELGIKSRKI